jgi:hypothetical protein
MSDLVMSSWSKHGLFSSSAFGNKLAKTVYHPPIHHIHALFGQTLDAQGIALETDLDM